MTIRTTAYSRFLSVILMELLLMPSPALADGCSLPAFGGARLFPAANNSQAMTIGDFNQDGFSDLAVVNVSGSISVLLGMGDGTFQAPVNYSMNNPSWVVNADFNGDGKLDLAVSADLRIFVMLGNGDGSFQRGVATSTPANVMAVGDFNADGKPDLAINGTPVYILLGRGDGTFQTPPIMPSGTISAGFGVAAGDFNGDGKLDTVAGSSSGIFLLLGDGTGKMAAPISVSAGTSFGPENIAVGDLNGDRKLDVVTVTSLNHKVSVLLGNGNGTFQPAAGYDVGDLATGVAIADLNRDGTADLAVANHLAFTTPGTISVFPGNGDGSFLPPVQYNPTSQANWALGASDFNRDGIMDLVFTSIIQNAPTQVGVMLGNADGTLQSPRSYPAGAIPRSPVLADFNGDGVLDVAVTSAGLTGNIYVMLGKPEGGFQEAVSYPTPFGPKSMAAGDLNGDGKPDLVVANIVNSNLLVFLGNGDGTFQESRSTGGLFTAFHVALGDFNGDGRLDAAVVGISGVQILPGNGDGTFRGSFASFGACLGCGQAPATVADLNGDGKLDLVLANADLETMTGFGNSGSVTVLVGNGDGTFKNGVNYAIGANAVSVAVGDLNGDGAPDLVAADFGSNRFSSTTNTTGAVAVLLGNGDGTFQRPTRYAAAPGTASVAVADFDGDGLLDVAVTSRAIKTAAMFLGNGDGTLRSPLTYGAGGDPANFTVGDLNGDGKPDLVIVDDLANSVLTMMNTYVPGVTGSPCAQAPVLAN